MSTVVYIDEERLITMSTVVYIDEECLITLSTVYACCMHACDDHYHTRVLNKFTPQHSALF